MASKVPAAPAGLKRSGRALWRGVLERCELDEHEVAVLREACRTADAIDALQTQLDNDGVMSESSQGVRVHPALPELRQQRLALARLLAALGIPAEEEGAGSERKPARGGVRGVYSIAGGAS